MIGGFLGRDETIIDGALREIKEETGYEAKIVGLLRVKNEPHRPNEDRQNISFFLISEALEKTGEADDESTEVKLFYLDNLPSP